MATESTTTGAFIGRILDAIDFNDPTLRRGGITSAGARNTTLDTGDTITVSSPAGDTSALQLIEQLLEAERGVFYISGGGIATYEERNSRAHRTTNAATITDAAVKSNPGFQLDKLVNRQTVSRKDPATGNDTGSAQTASNDVSIGLFGVSSGSSISSQYLPTDGQALALASYIVNLRSDFETPVVVELDSGDATALTQQLTRELQDRVTVNDTVAGTSGDYIIEAIEHEISDGGNRLITRFTLSKYGATAIVFAADAASSPITFAPPDGTATFTTCTSGTRPGSPSDGDYVFETDTGRYYERVSGAWVEQVYPRFTY
ncbi:MAG: hypothetical protein ACO3HV_12110 [Candidatus Nanopelagicales bacterium]